MHNTIAHPPGTTTSDCHGIQKTEADSVAFITCTRYGIPAEHAFASPLTWAGTDPRAQPAAVILTAGERITTAAAKISRLLDHYLAGDRPAAQPAAEPATPRHSGRPLRPAAAQVTAPLPAPGPDPRISGVLNDALRFYDGQLARSWVPAYLAERGIDDATSLRWRIASAGFHRRTIVDAMRIDLAQCIVKESLAFRGRLRGGSGRPIQSLTKRVPVQAAEQDGNCCKSDCD